MGVDKYTVMKPDYDGIIHVFFLFFFNYISTNDYNDIFD